MLIEGLLIELRIVLLIFKGLSSVFILSVFAQLRRLMFYPHYLLREVNQQQPPTTVTHLGHNMIVDK